MSTTKLLDIDETMPPVTQIKRGEPATPKPQQKAIGSTPEWAAAREVMEDFIEVYTDSADYLEENVDKATASNDRMVVGILTASKNSRNPVEYLNTRIRALQYTTTELRTVMQEIIAEELRTKNAAKRGKK